MTPFTKVTGVAAPLMMDDINTDQVIPSAYVRRLNSDLAEGLFAYMRRSPDGTSNADFVLEKPQFRSSAILIVGRNFGCGSSREHAAWAMVAFGIRCIIGVSHAEYFRENCLKNGMLPISLESVVVEEIASLAREIDGAQEFTIDLERQTIELPGRGRSWSFDIAPFDKVALLEGLDEIGLTSKYSDEILDWEKRTRSERPFLQKLSF
jgi:3-isopropylmalate/(R)-2-methylmalate dehydratase small subunit